MTIKSLIPRKTTTIGIALLGLVIVIAMAIYAQKSLWRRQEAAKITGDTTGVAEVVKRYDLILADVYEQNKPDLLADVATAKQIRRVDIYLTYNRTDKKSKLHARLKKLSIGKTRKNRNSAVVNTVETWKYSYEDLRTKKISDRTTDTYRIVYKLVKIGVVWKVDSLQVNTLRSKSQSPPRQDS